MKFCETGYRELVKAYLRQMMFDYKRAIKGGDVKSMTTIEKDIQSEFFFGEIIGVTAGPVLDLFRHIEVDGCKIIRDKMTRYPIRVEEVEKKKKDGETKGRKTRNPKTTG